MGILRRDKLITQIQIEYGLKCKAKIKFEVQLAVQYTRSAEFNFPNSSTSTSCMASLAQVQFAVSVYYVTAIYPICIGIFEKFQIGIHLQQFLIDSERIVFLRRSYETVFSLLFCYLVGKGQQTQKLEKVRVLSYISMPSAIFPASALPVRISCQVLKGKKINSAHFIKRSLNCVKLLFCISHLILITVKQQ